MTRQNPLSTWKVIDPAATLAEVKRKTHRLSGTGQRAGELAVSGPVVYELSTPNGMYHYVRSGSRYNYLAFFGPDKKMRWFEENLTPAEAGAVGELQIETLSALRALVEGLRE